MHRTQTPDAAQSVPQLIAGDDLTGFSQQAHAHGFSCHEVTMMKAALPSLGLHAATAAAWMAGGFTPWAVPVWRHNGFGPGEAAEARARGETPESAYYARLDRQPSAAAREMPEATRPS
jgi:hypothetical protein